jgi:hypothetical protein
MYQKEIQFFWPLTEQIPLDLDYSECVKPTLSVCNINTGITISNPISNTSIITGNIDVEQINFTLNKNPNIIKKLALKLLGISWKVK